MISLHCQFLKARVAWLQLSGQYFICGSKEMVRRKWQLCLWRMDFHFLSSAQLPPLSYTFSPLLLIFLILFHSLSVFFCIFSSSLTAQENCWKYGCFVFYWWGREGCTDCRENQCHLWHSDLRRCHVNGNLKVFHDCLASYSTHHLCFEDTVICVVKGIVNSNYKYTYFGCCWLVFFSTYVGYLGSFRSLWLALASLFLDAFEHTMWI